VSAVQTVNFLMQPLPAFRGKGLPFGITSQDG